MHRPAAPRLRIVHAPPFYHPVHGGAETHVRALSEGLAARGHQVSVLTQRQNSFMIGGADALPARDQVGPLPVQRLGLSPRRAALAERCLRLPGVWGALTRLGGPSTPRLMAHEAWSPFAGRALRGADVVLISNLGYGEWAHRIWRAARRARAAVVAMPLIHAEEQWPHRALTREILRGCDVILANTAFEREFCAALGAPGAHVVGTGVEPRDFERADGPGFRQRHALGDAPVVGFVGRLERLKGLVLLVEAMRLVWRERPAARLVLAGRPHPAGSVQAEEVRAALASLDAAERARLLWLEHVPASELPSLFAALDVFALPSVVESFGMVYLEAWMCRRPVVGARTGAVAAVIDDGRDGRLVDPADPRELAAVLSGLLADPDQRAAMGEAGRAKVLARYTWDQQVERVEAIYQDLIRRLRR